MNLQKPVYAWLIALLLAIPGPSPAETAKASPLPSPLDAAIDACAECKMSVKDSGYAAQAIADDGRVYKFDDLGCLFAFLSADTSIVPAARYVQDANSRSWIALEKAYYVVSKEVPTPMGYGIHAFASKGAAEAFAKARKDKAKVVALGDLSIPTDSEMKM
jgi:copper chaperone NosL